MDEGRLGKNLLQAFSRAGVVHVLSISGLHISLVAAAAYGAWWWLLGRSRYLLLACTMPKLAALLTIPPVLLYAGLAGGSVATWRSVVMVLVYLVAIVLDRQEEVYRSLAVTGQHAADEAQLRRLEAVLKSRERSVSDRISAGFALGAGTPQPRSVTDDVFDGL